MEKIIKCMMRVGIPDTIRSIARGSVDVDGADAADVLLSPKETAVTRAGAFLLSADPDDDVSSDIRDTMSQRCPRRLAHLVTALLLVGTVQILKVRLVTKARSHVL